MTTTMEMANGKANGKLEGSETDPATQKDPNALSADPINQQQKQGSEADPATQKDPNALSADPINQQQKQILQRNTVRPEDRNLQDPPQITLQKQQPLPGITSNNQRNKQDPPLPGITSNNQRNEQDPPLPGITSNNQRNEEDRVNVCVSVGGCALLALTIVGMVAVVVVVSTSKDISKVKPCDLKTALDLINVNDTTDLCKYNEMKDFSNSLSFWNILELIFNSILFFVILFNIVFARMNPHLLPLRTVFSITNILIIANGIFIILSNYPKLSKGFEIAERQPTIDYVQLQTTMVSMLEQQYSSDNISTSDANSRNWNNFFIQYDCCAVREVQGTRNDFDKTPWCTTSGSCQSTASQIPKTCCKDVTQDDYQNAPSVCHASVNSGTYKPSCISRMRTLSTVNKEEYKLTTLYLSLGILLLFQVLESILAFLLIVILPVIHCLDKDKKDNAKKRPDGSQSP